MKSLVVLLVIPYQICIYKQHSHASLQAAYITFQFTAVDVQKVTMTNSYKPVWLLCWLWTHALMQL